MSAAQSTGRPGNLDPGQEHTLKKFQQIVSSPGHTSLSRRSLQALTPIPIFC